MRVELLLSLELRCQQAEHHFIQREVKLNICFLEKYLQGHFFCTAKLYLQSEEASKIQCARSSHLRLVKKLENCHFLIVFLKVTGLFVSCLGVQWRQIQDYLCLGRRTLQDFRRFQINSLRQTSEVKLLLYPSLSIIYFAHYFLYHSSARPSSLPLNQGLINRNNLHIVNTLSGVRHVFQPALLSYLGHTAKVFACNYSAPQEAASPFRPRRRRIAILTACERKTNRIQLQCNPTPWLLQPPGGNAVRVGRH